MSSIHLRNIHLLATLLRLSLSLKDAKHFVYETKTSMVTKRKIFAELLFISLMVFVSKEFKCPKQS